MWTRTWFGAFVEAAIWFLLAVILLANVPSWGFNLATQNIGLNEFWGNLIAGIIAGGTITIYVGAGIARVRWGQQKDRQAARQLNAGR
ncbi:MAG: hypothetical protein ACYDAG_02320 [Chloroflexota bacterium]